MHRLTEISVSEKQANCSICGTVRIYLIKSGNWTCSNRVKKRARDKAIERGGYPKRVYTPEQTFRKRLRQFGLSLEDYNTLLDLQNHACRICVGVNKNGNRLAIDHDHSCCPHKYKACGRCVRGLLCSNCNTAIGLAQENPETLRAMADYLESL